MSQRQMGQRAALIGVLVAFLVGIVGSLAVRPPGTAAQSGANSEVAVRKRINWRLPVAFPTNLPVLGENAIYVTNMIRDVSGGAVDLRIYEPGEIVPAFSITDAVRDHKVKIGYTWLGYDQGKIPASTLLGAVPFGMEPWEVAAWWYEAGGRELGEKLYLNHNIHPIFCGLTGPETAGWFRNPITSLEDVQGLKIRFAGLGGKVIERVGASVTMLPGGEIFQALEKGAIDASEYALPIVDRALGFHQIASYNYYPGWHQPATSTHLLVNIETWHNMAGADQKLLEAVCTAGVIRNLSNAEASQGAVIAGFPDIGVSAETLPDEVLRELQRVTEIVLAEEAAKDESFREILESQKAFRATYAHWKSRAYLPRDF
ncbi:MAG: TRAP transporter substrate-binding protein [Gammaproteobacteria bacterium]|nr:TRAP transporter substrate-binding protein [Gammaproteobacteria bacterium]